MRHGFQEREKIMKANSRRDKCQKINKVVSNIREAVQLKAQ